MTGSQWEQYCLMVEALVGAESVDGQLNCIGFRAARVQRVCSQRHRLDGNFSSPNSKTASVYKSVYIIYPGNCV